MKAVVYHDYGSPDHLELQEVEMPAVEDDQVLVKVHAASVNWLDWHFLTGTPFLVRIMAGGLFKPKQKILGIDVAGRVEAVGGSITQVRSLTLSAISQKGTPEEKSLLRCKMKDIMPVSWRMRPYKRPSETGSLV